MELESELQKVAAATPTLTEPLAPVEVTERILTLDVLRGFALFGILMVNMQFFAMPFMVGVSDSTLVEEPASEVLSWAIVQWFFEYKFVSLFSLLFGIGFSVQLLRAQVRGTPFVPVYLRRLGVLCIIGLAHAILLWYGDILFMYSLIAIVLLLTRSFGPRGLMMTAALAWLVGTISVSSLSGLQVWLDQQQSQQVEVTDAALLVDHSDPADKSTDDTADDDEFNADEDAQAVSDQTHSALRRFSDLNGNDFDPNSEAWLEVETNAFKHGPFTEAVIIRAISFVYMLVFSALSFAWHILAMFLLGAALLKLNFFAPRHLKWHRLLALGLLPIGVVIEGVGVYVEWVSEYASGWHLVGTAAMHEVGSVAMCLGIVGAWYLTVQSGALQWLTNALAKTGRMALTNYLTQTVVATFLMYWWGLGWFDDVSRAQQIGLVLLIYPLQIVFSLLWLRSFTIGPMEWLWRSLTYLKFQPVRRGYDVTSTTPVGPSS